MTALRQRLLEDLQLRGYSVGTQQLYVRAMRQCSPGYLNSIQPTTRHSWLRSTRIMRRAL
jgi:hypothetical protein